jgi:hypothetical protein
MAILSCFALSSIGIYMPKKKGRPIGKMLLGVVLIAVVAVGVIAWHDGLIGITSIKDINDGLIAAGTPVTIKGEVTFRLLNVITITQGSNSVLINWAGASTLNSIVVVRGIVSSILTLVNVTSVDIVWLFS